MVSICFDGFQEPEVRARVYPPPVERLLLACLSSGRPVVVGARPSCVQVEKAVEIFNTMRAEGCQMNTAP